MHRRARLLRFIQPTSENVPPNPRFSQLDQASISLHKMLTDPAAINPPKGLADRTIARINQTVSLPPQNPK